jgi:hypothetical protein
LTSLNFSASLASVKFANMMRPQQERSVVSLRELAPGDTVLASGPKGERHRGMIEQEAGEARVVVLDLEGVETLTPSYFRGAFWFLWSQPERYPLLSNAPKECYEDLNYFLFRERGLIWAGSWTGETLEEVELLGPYEELDAQLLHRAGVEGEISAVELAEREGDLSLTGWNNRLAGLWRQRLLRRRKVGRRYVYHLPWRYQNG